MCVRVCLLPSPTDLKCLHVEGHVVWFPISVCIGNVVDGGHRQDNLSGRVDDGQVNNGPALREEEEEGDLSRCTWRAIR